MIIVPKKRLITIFIPCPFPTFAKAPIRFQFKKEKTFILFINEKKNIKRIAVAIALEICLFFLSYAVIFQPYYEPEIEGEVAVDETNAYLIKEDDEYRIIINDEDWGIVPKDDLKTRPYCRLEIRE